MTLTLTEQQREYILDRMVHSMNDAQESDTYHFEYEGIDIIWVSDYESYVVLHQSGTYDQVAPSDILGVISDFQDATLVEWFCEQEGCDLEDLQEYLEDGMLEAAE